MTAHAITHCRLADGQFVQLVTDLADRMVGASIRRSGSWEPAETILVQALVAPGEQVADIGAHVGYFTVLLSKLVGPAGKVVAFEPEADNFELLRANCILNGCNNVRPEPLAVADRSGRAELYLAVGNLGDHRLHATPGRPSREVGVVRFDEYWAGGRLDFIKLDAQGGEAAILRGATETIRTNAGHLLALMELSPALSRSAGHELGSVAELLDRLDAHAISVVPGWAGRLGLLDRGAFSALWHELLASEYDDANASLLLAFSDTGYDKLRARIANLETGAGPP